MGDYIIQGIVELPNFTFSFQAERCTTLLRWLELSGETTLFGNNGTPYFSSFIFELFLNFSAFPPS